MLTLAVLWSPGQKLCQPALNSVSFLSDTWSSVLSQVPGFFQLNYVHVVWIVHGYVFLLSSTPFMEKVSYVSSYRIPFLSNYSFLSQGSHSAWRWSTSIWIAFPNTFSILRSSTVGRWVIGAGKGESLCPMRLPRTVSGLPGVTSRYLWSSLCLQTPHFLENSFAIAAFFHGGCPVTTVKWYGTQSHQLCFLS